MKEKKAWYKSKTFWFNVVTGIVTIADHATGIPFIPPMVTAGITTFGNIILRTWFTDQKLAPTQKAADESATLTPVN